MPDELIRFPAIDGVTGTTCGVYAYSYFSGCTDDQGITRGFTQEWYFDGDIGAWVSVTQGVTGGGADLSDVTDPYTTISHAAPEMTGTGDIRKIAFVDPTTGGLTYDYISTYDIINPAERAFSVNDFRVTMFDDYLPTGQLSQSYDNYADKRLEAGTTLCGDADYEFVIGATGDNSQGYKFYINRRENSGAFSDYEKTVSLFAPAPGNSADQFVLDSPGNTALYTLTQPAGIDPDRVLPFEGGTYANQGYFAGVSGEVLFASGGDGSFPNGPYKSPVIGFTTAGGPRLTTFEPVLKYSSDPDVGGVDSSLVPRGTRFVRTENWLYFASILESELIDDLGLETVTYDNALDWITEARLKSQRADVNSDNQSLLGLRLVLDPRTRGNNNGNPVNNPENTATMSGYQRLSYNLDETNFVRNDGERYFVVVAIPTRALPESTLTAAQRRNLFALSLQQTGNGPAGFSGNIFKTLNITNERNYQEEYTIFVSEFGNGINTVAPKFKLRLDRL